jgi:hypothetical protein
MFLHGVLDDDERRNVPDAGHPAVAPATQGRTEPGPRIDTSWTLTRSADGSIAIVTGWHLHSDEPLHPAQARQVGR